MVTRRIKFKSEGYDLVGELNLPPNTSKKLPTIILFHGLTNSRIDCPLINETSHALTENSFAVLRFDFFGSGESPGEMKDKTIDILLQNAKDSIEYTTKNPLVNSNRLGLFGRSFGGTVVCLLDPDKRIKARVIASPPVLLEKTMKPLFKIMKQKARQGMKIVATGKYKGAYDLGPAWFNSLKGLAQRATNNLKQLDSVLVLGTARDQKVTLQDVCTVINNLTEPKKIWIYDAEHDYAGVEKQAVQETVTWFKKYL